MILLEVHDAHRAFAATRALNGVSLRLHAGEMLGLLGPNGAGKSTLVRACSGRVRLDRGAVRIAGRACAPGAPRPELGVVPQDLALYGRLTARENLALFGRLHGVERAELPARVRWALEWTALEDHADRRVETFSGGMKRRLNLACGVLHRPRVVLLDEPTVGVDPHSREKLHDMLATLRSDGAAVLLTTHQLEEAEARCERIVILDHGRSVAAGTLPELVATAGLAGRRVRITIERPAEAAPAGMALAGNSTTLTAQVHEVVRELPELLARVAAAGHAVRDLEVRTATLQHVFLELTGREVRE